MPVEGLPKILENTLDTLLEENLLSSWNIKGGQYFIQLNLRFTTASNQPSQREVKYRRAPPSQIARDRQHAETHETTNTYNSDTHDMPLSIIPTMDTNKKDSTM